LDTEKTTHAGGAYAACYNCGSISSTTAASGETSRQHSEQRMGMATEWKAGRCHHVQISELFSMEKYNQEVVDFLAATDVGKFPPKLADEPRQQDHEQKKHR